MSGYEEFLDQSTFTNSCLQGHKDRLVPFAISNLALMEPYHPSISPPALGQARSGILSLAAEHSDIPQLGVMHSAVCVSLCVAVLFTNPTGDEMMKFKADKHMIKRCVEYAPNTPPLVC